MILQSGNCRSFLALITISFLVMSCRQVDIYEKNTSIPHYKWQHNYAVNGSFLIKDTSHAYNIYIVLRHTDAYQYNNIWLNIGFQEPGDTMVFQNKDLRLGTDANGWEGTGMNDIWEVRKLIYVHRFKTTGEYKFNIRQIMRDDPLPNIMSAGMRVQKAN